MSLIRRRACVSAARYKGEPISRGLIMAFDKDAGLTAGNADLSVARDAWVKPEILSFEPVSAAQGLGSAIGEGTNNVS
ncbi:MAG: hypothetical protein V4475_09700 [Pseudomonadota bacterium]